jgi:hypothetical protein
MAIIRSGNERNRNLIVLPSRAPLCPDVIDDEDLGRVAQLQSAAWLVHCAATDALRQLEERIDQGAQVVAQRFYVDRVRRMVRSKKSA